MQPHHAVGVFLLGGAPGLEEFTHATKCCCTKLSTGTCSPELPNILCSCYMVFDDIWKNNKEVGGLLKTQNVEFRIKAPVCGGLYLLQALFM